jgi:hypothetical protein
MQRKPFLFAFVTTLILVGCNSPSLGNETAVSVLPATGNLSPSATGASPVTTVIADTSNLPLSTYTSLPLSTSGAPAITTSEAVIVHVQWGKPPMMTHPVEGRENCYLCHLYGGSAPFHIETTHSCQECHSPGPLLHFSSMSSTFTCTMCHAPGRDYAGPTSTK